jgi:hypothetical protein
MKKDELINVRGGGLSATFISAISRGVNTFYELGRSFGSAVRRAISGKTCQL